MKTLAKIYYNEKARSILFQIAFFLIILFLINYLLNTLFYNIEKRGIRSGFDFLNSTAGFSVPFSLIDYNEAYPDSRTFLVGLTNTILVSIIGIFFCGIFGFFVGLLRLSNNWLIVKITSMYIEIFRNIPLLLQILLWHGIFLGILPKKATQITENSYVSLNGLTIPDMSFKTGLYVMLAILFLLIITTIYLQKKKMPFVEKRAKKFFTIGIFSSFLIYFFVFFNSIDLMFQISPPVKGKFSFSTGTTIIPEIFSLCFSLSFYHATYVAEAVRSGIESVGKGQREAAESLGLSSWSTLNLIIVPQSLRVIIPPTTNYFLNLAKNSSLATAIGFPDLVNIFAGTTLNQVGQAIEIMLMTMAVYLFISLSISLLMNWYNKRIQLIEK